MAGLGRITTLNALHKHIAVAISLLLLLAVFCGQAWQLYRIHAGKFIDDTALLIKAGPTQTSGENLQEIAARHLFGNPAAKPAAETEKPTTLPVTDLKFVLVGAITDSVPDKASALIQAENNTQRYFVGDDIKGQAVLQEVSDNSVVLKRGNRLEKLEFPKGLDANPVAKAQIADMIKNNTPDTKSVVQPTPISPQPSSASKPVDVKDEKKGRSLRDKLQNRPKDVQKQPGS